MEYHNAVWLEWRTPKQFIEFHADKCTPNQKGSMYRILENQAELDEILLPVLRQNGSEIPKAGCYVAHVEFDEQGQVLAYQLIQNALFLEGLWARDSSAHLLAVYRGAAKFAQERLGADRILTMTRQDATGNRIGRIAEKLGFEKLNWNIFRRKA